MTSLEAGGQFPHVDLTRLDGTRVAYRDIWQKRNLLLVVLPQEGSAEYAAQLDAHASELTAYDTTCIVTRQHVDGVPSPGVAIADRWGELSFVAPRLPPVNELVDWLRYTQMQCPECQGEVR